MKRIIYYLFFLTLMFNSCVNKPSITMNKLGESIDLKYNSSIDIQDENLRITLVNVEDSRCPKKNQCFWEGEAKLYLKIKKNSKEEMFVSKVKGLCYDEGGDCGSEIEVLGYTISVNYLYPYPKRDYPSKNKYRARLIIKKL